jgi:hypothetical protein
VFGCLLLVAVSYFFVGWIKQSGSGIPSIGSTIAGCATLHPAYIG